MADLAAEMARFEAELAGVSDGGATGLPPPPQLPNGAATPPPFMQGPPGHLPMPPGPVPGMAPPPMGGLPPPALSPPPGAGLPPPPMLAPPAGLAPPMTGGGYPAEGIPRPAFLPPPAAAAGPAAFSGYGGQPSAGGYAQPAYPDPQGYQMFSAPAQNYHAYAAPAAAAVPGAVQSAEALRSVREAFEAQGKAKTEKKPALKRHAAGQTWWDPTMVDWDPNDYRIFVGDLGNEVNDDILYKAFSHYGSIKKAKMVKNKITGKNKGYGFVSFGDSIEGAKALKEMNGRYVGNRPCKLSKSTWDERNAKPSGGKKLNGKVPAPYKKPAGLLHK